MPRAVELDLDQSASAMEMAEEIFGAGVSVESATYSGDPDSSGIYTGADTTSAGVAPSDSGVILSTGHADDFTNGNNRFNTNQSGSRTTNTSGEDNNALFNAVAGTSTYDASYLSVDFTPTGDTLTIDFVLSSEEYPEYLSYNDAVGVWVNGVPAQISVGDGTASISNINDANQNIYVDNTGDQYNTEMDGFTITLTFVAPVNVGVVNTLIIGVADSTDSSYDTNLLIAGGSVQTSIVAQDDSVGVEPGGSTTIDPLANDSSTGGGTLSVTHINEVAVNPGDSVVLATGQSVTLNANGTFTITADGDVETAYFNYTIEDSSSGNSDTALVEIVQDPPCFTHGTMILTEEGEYPVEALEPGMRLETLDGGLQHLVWVGRTTLPVNAENSPVRIAAGVLGNDRDLVVSPQHRILLSGAASELLFGSEQVLVKAKDLVNDSTVTRCHRHDIVTYFHVLLEDHHLIRSNGQWSESFLPGPCTMQSFDAGTTFSLMLAMAETGCHHDLAARPSLRSFEARALLAA